MLEYGVLNHFFQAVIRNAHFRGRDNNNSPMARARQHPSLAAGERARLSAVAEPGRVGGGSQFSTLSTKKFWGQNFSLLVIYVVYFHQKSLCM